MASDLALRFGVERHDPASGLSRAVVVSLVLGAMLGLTIAGVAAGYSFGYLHGYDQGFELGSRGRLPEVADAPDWSKVDWSKVGPLRTGPPLEDATEPPTADAPTSP